MPGSGQNSAGAVRPSNQSLPVTLQTTCYFVYPTIISPLDGNTQLSCYSAFWLPVFDTSRRSHPIQDNPTWLRIRC